MPKTELLAHMDGPEGPFDIFITTGDPRAAEIITFTGDLDVDCDGTGGNPYDDPYFQPRTRLKVKGQYLHAESMPYAVVPPIIIQKTVGIVMGSKVICTNLKNKRRAIAVVGDSGPLRKIGEGSPALCELLGLSGNPNTGGTDDKIIKMEILVGVPAIVQVHFTLQPS